MTVTIDMETKFKKLKINSFRKKEHSDSAVKRGAAFG